MLLGAARTAALAPETGAPEMAVAGAASVAASSPAGSPADGADESGTMTAGRACPAISCSGKTMASTCNTTHSQQGLTMTWDALEQPQHTRTGAAAAGRVVARTETGPGAVRFHAAGCPAASAEEAPC